MRVETKNLILELQTREEVLAELQRMEPRERAEVSPAWLALVEGASSADPWLHGFILVHRTNGGVVGRCGFKGPPGADGAVEIAYGIDPEHQGKGYATQAAEALTNFAFHDRRVRLVRAHTLPETNASTRVLVKCGFRKIGEVVDPEDGLVWRWENPGGHSYKGKTYFELEQVGAPSQWNTLRALRVLKWWDQAKSG